MNTKRVNLYKPKSLIDGAQIGEKPGSQWVAVPSQYAGHPFVVEYGGITMHVKDWKREARQFKRFRDKYWRAGSDRQQYYTLGYFSFEPDPQLRLV